MLKFPSTIPPARPPAALGAADRLLGLWTHSPGRVSGYEGGVAVPPRGQGGAGMRSQWPGVHQLDMADMAQKSVGLKITPMAPGQFWQFFVKGPGLFNLEHRGSNQVKIGGRSQVAHSEEEISGPDWWPHRCTRLKQRRTVNVAGRQSVPRMKRI